MVATAVEQAVERAQMELCEWASVNPDGTHTMIRAGIDRWTATVPLDILLWSLVELPAGVTVGRHHFEFAIHDPSGVRAASVSGEVAVTGARRTMFSLPLQWTLSAYGLWSIRFYSGNIRADATLDVKPA